MITNTQILILEDDPIISMDLEDELFDHGHYSVCAATVPEARKILERQKPSFALLDMHLRGDTTFELARELREQAVPFVFISGNDRSSLPEDLKSSKVLTKPVDRNELIKEVAETKNGQ